MTVISLNTPEYFCTDVNNRRNRHEHAMSAKGRRGRRRGTAAQRIICPITHIPQIRERKKRIVNTQDQAGEEPADEALAAPEPGCASVTQCGCARDQCPQNIGKSSASWGGWSVC